MPPLQNIPMQEATSRFPGKCTWNKKYKGYRFKSICNELKVTFKICHLFTVEWVGTQKRRIRRVNDGAQGWRILRGRMIMMDGSRMEGRAVINTK